MFSPLFIAKKCSLNVLITMLLSCAGVVIHRQSLGHKKFSPFVSNLRPSSKTLHNKVNSNLGIAAVFLCHSSAAGLA